MNKTDLPAAVRLTRDAGWNQDKEDWQRFLTLGADACFVAERDGEVLGTTVTCMFGSVAWIAMVIVASKHRGNGIGGALTRHAVEFLDAAGALTIRLDATPLGQPIYEKLGFTSQYEIVRYQGCPTTEGTHVMAE